MFIISPSCSFIWSSKVSLLVDSNPQMQQQKSRTQYSVPRWGRLTFFSESHEVFAEELSFWLSSELVVLFAVWPEESDRDETSRWLVKGTELSSGPSATVFPGSWLGDLGKRERGRQVILITKLGSCNEIAGCKIKPLGDFSLPPIVLNRYSPSLDDSCSPKSWTTQ